MGFPRPACLARLGTRELRHCDLHFASACKLYNLNRCKLVEISVGDYRRAHLRLRAWATPMKVASAHCSASFCPSVTGRLVFPCAYEEIRFRIQLACSCAKTF